MSLHVVILAAGQGKRMQSALPKVLHPIAGQPMLKRVVETACRLNPERIHVVIGHGGAQIQQALSDLPVAWVVQKEQLGTGHAVMQALPMIPLASDILILYADVPLIDQQELEKLISPVRSGHASLALLLLSAEDPTGLGRIVRNEVQQIQAIVEEKDANELQKQIREIYTGICCARAEDLARWLPQLNAANAQQEYYLTEIIAMAVKERKTIDSIHAADSLTVQGVNDRVQLSQLERAFQLKQAKRLLLAGVTLADPARIDIRGQLTCERDVFIDVNAVFSGDVCLGEGSHIGPNCSLHDVTIGKNCYIHANSVLEDCQVGDACQIGPFARLRPGTELGRGCKIGNFVETKKAVFDAGSQASHLSYLGDVTIGKAVNIGAGTITCNYDGMNKHQTIIEDGAFIGSDTQLVAPVTIGKNATIGAGSTIRKSAPAEELTLTESKQKTVYGWVRPKKKEYVEHQE